MDNIFNSINLACRTYSRPYKVIFHSVIHNNGCGVPATCVVQEEAKGKQTDMGRGTVKVALLKEDSRFEVARKQLREFVSVNNLCTSSK